MLPQLQADSSCPSSVTVPLYSFTSLWTKDLSIHLRPWHFNRQTLLNGQHYNMNEQSWDAAPSADINQIRSIHISAGQGHFRAISGGYLQVLMVVVAASLDASVCFTCQSSRPRRILTLDDIMSVPDKWCHRSGSCEQRMPWPRGKR